MRKTAQSHEMDTEMLSRLGAAYLRTIFSDRIEEAETLDDAIGMVIEKTATKFTEVAESYDCFLLVESSAKLAFEAGQIVRTQPGPVALEMLEKLVLKIEGEIQAHIDKASKTAA